MAPRGIGIPASKQRSRAPRPYPNIRGVRMKSRGDGSYVVYDGLRFIGIVRKLNVRRWTCAPPGAGADPRVEVTEHSSRRLAVHRLATL